MNKKLVEGKMIQCSPFDTEEIDGAARADGE
jgi:hypothetical protein